MNRHSFIDLSGYRRFINTKPISDLYQIAIHHDLLVIPAAYLVLPLLRDEVIVLVST